MSTGIAWVLLSLFITISVSVRLEVAYPDVDALSSVVDIRTAPGDDTLVFVVQQSGRIYTFDPNNFQGFTEFLDMRTLVRDSASEQGLLSLVFHPNYQSNGYFYVYFSSSERASTMLSRFRRESGATQVSISTELRYLVIDQPFSNHNGGQLHFGTDGYLYISVGDGGSANDPQNNGQNPNTLLGTMLRIDVDNADGDLNYSIPSDNPFVDGGGQPEVYFYGLRNPWRFDIDEATGLVWIADVGQNAFEEVSVGSAAGQNFGWNVMEACACLNSGCTVEDDFVMPIHSYGRSVGTSITGGYVYRGSELGSDLQNHYIFGDFVSGRIFAIDVNDRSENCGTSAVELLDTSVSISTFGLIHGDLIVVDYGSGVFYKLSPDAPASPQASPTSSRTPSMSAAVDVSSSPNVPTPPTTYANQVTTVRDSRTIVVQWTIEGSYGHFMISGTATGYVAMGFSADGSMNSGGQGSDIVLGFLNGQGNVNDYWATAKSQPELDEQQNLFHTSVVQNGGTLQMRFTRALVTSDSFEDRALSCSSIYFIWAVSDTQPTDIDTFGYHAGRGSFEIPNLCATNGGAASASPSGTATPVPSSSTTRTGTSSSSPIPSASATRGSSSSSTPVISPSPSSTPTGAVLPSSSSTPATRTATATANAVSASPVPVSGTPSNSPNVVDISSGTTVELTSLDDSSSNVLTYGTVVLLAGLFYLFPL